VKTIMLVSNVYTYQTRGICIPNDYHGFIPGAIGWSLSNDEMNKMARAIANRQKHSMHGNWKNVG
jgi:hypothetical protein